ncbi:MAG: class I SAM-dependent methyltransferase [Alphaproteobacteria bacterium]|nr:class I SAM-dependent methyltransferase [Alphaproteobacteria bacterium]
MNKKLVVILSAMLFISIAFKILKNNSLFEINQLHTKTPGIGIQANLKILDQFSITPPILSKTGKSFVTLNKMGFDINYTNLSWVAEEFINFCEEHPGEYVLDVGAGYGFLSRYALSKRMFVISNDLEMEHLLYSRKKVKNPDEILRLFLNTTPFPYLDIKKNSLRAVILHRVLHFLPGAEIDLGLENINSWLKEDGKVYIMVMSTEHIAYREQVLPDFERRKKNGDLWPGMFLDVPKYLPTQAYCLPEQLHIMDQEVLKNALQRHGFEIERIGYVSMQGFGTEDGRDGKEAIGAIAVKKTRK